MKIEREGCDVFHVDDWPQAALDDVLEVEINLYVDKETVIEHSGVMCAKARARLFNGIQRLLKPPAKRKKETDA